jgi:hypothetical protein
MGSVTSMFRSPERFLPWIPAAAAALALSLSIPLLSAQRPENAVVGYAPLFPVYFQTNVDAPLELSTCLGFPGYFREDPYRVSRPVLYALVAGARALARPLAGRGDLLWGRWPARDYLLTYGFWLLANFALVLAALRMAYRLAAARLGVDRGAAACLMLLFSPIVLLAMREIHLNALHFFLGLAGLAFWHVVFTRDLSAARLFLLSLALGLGFLGKPALQGFLAGLALCPFLGKSRKLALILPGVLLPAALWYLAARALGFHYGVPEVSHWKAGIWIFEAGWPGFWREFGWYAVAWFHALHETIGIPHLAFAAAGGFFIARERPAFLRLGLLIAATDFAFYFLVHRVHAVYYMNTAFVVFLLAAEGMARAAVHLARLAARRGFASDAGENPRPRWVFAAALAIQAAVCLRQLPLYPG